MNHAATFVIVLLLLLPRIAKSDSTEDLAKGILEQSGVQGGLIVHVGCGEGPLKADRKSVG